ncbi:MAG: hypothetical protein Q4G28_05295 [Neisseria sp.]|nr:hypothetical protein [Neisseria sp.]
MKMTAYLLITAAMPVLVACASTPEQKAARAAAQQRYEQNLQVALAGQCDKETAELMRRQFDPPENQTEKERQAFRLEYVDKVADPMFQACYKMAWQNYISQQRLREMRYYYDDYWDDFYYPFRRPFRRW